MATFLDRFRALVRQAESAGWAVVEERAIPYGRMATLSDGGQERANLSCYDGKKGFKVVTAGKAGERLAGSLGLAGGRAAPPPTSGPDPFGLGTPRIGADESGKGDFFGPLVVAAYRLEEGAADDLLALGVGDSKRFGKTKIERLAGHLDETGHGEVLALEPPEYNARYAKTRNLNTLLSELHAVCISRLAQRSGGHPAVVVVDRFTSNEHVLLSCLELPPTARLVTRTRAEADVAVAAASILARAEFVAGLARLEHEFGHAFPPGAGDPVLAAGRSFVRTFGAAELGAVAKTHFATSDRLQ